MNLYKLLEDKGKCTTYYAPSLEELVQRLLAVSMEGDLILTLGAGNINIIGKDLLSRLLESESQDRERAVEGIPENEMSGVV